MRKMKDINTIVADMIGQNSHYRPLVNAIYCKDFLNLMSQAHQRLIAKIFVKNKILHIITHSNIGYQEINHDDNKINIKILIKLYAKENPSSVFSEIMDVKIFTKRYDDFTPTPPPKPKKNHIELSLGKFRNPFENKKLFELFEKIRARIKCKMA